MGELIVNLPVSAIIILSAITCANIFKLGWSPSIIISSGIGWFFWDKLISVWVKWSKNKGLDPEKILHLGKIGLINFYPKKVYEHFPEVNKEN